MGQLRLFNIKPQKKGALNAAQTLETRMKHQGRHMASHLNESDFLLILSCAIAGSTQERKTEGKTLLDLNLPFLSSERTSGGHLLGFFKISPNSSWSEATSTKPSQLLFLPSLAPGFRAYQQASTVIYFILQDSMKLLQVQTCRGFPIQFIFLSRIYFFY